MLLNGVHRSRRFPPLLGTHHTYATSMRFCIHFCYHRQRPYRGALKAGRTRTGFEDARPVPFFLRLTDIAWTLKERTHLVHPVRIECHLINWSVMQQEGPHKVQTLVSTEDAGLLCALSGNCRFGNLFWEIIPYLLPQAVSKRGHPLPAAALLLWSSSAIPVRRWLTIATLK